MKVHFLSVKIVFNLKLSVTSIFECLYKENDFVAKRHNYNNINNYIFINSRKSIKSIYY